MNVSRCFAASRTRVHMIRKVNARPSERALAQRSLVSFETSLMPIDRYSSPIPTTANKAISWIDNLDI